MTPFSFFSFLRLNMLLFVCYFEQVNMLFILSGKNEKSERDVLPIDKGQPRPHDIYLAVHPVWGSIHQLISPPSD
jgi:hypothetical protein